MEWIRRKAKALLSVAAGAAIAAGCWGCAAIPAPREALPEDTIEELESAYNAMDVDGMIACIDEESMESIMTGMDLILGLAGAIIGVELDISAEDLIALIPLFEELGAYDTEDYPQIDFIVTETRIKGDRATVYFTEGNFGGSTSANMVREGGQWYITLGGRIISAEEADRILIPGEDEKETEEEGGERETGILKIDPDTLEEVWNLIFGQ